MRHKIQVLENFEKKKELKRCNVFSIQTNIAESIHICHKGL
jgi:hypothetical protein